MRTSAVRRPSADVCRAIQANGLPPGCDDPTTITRQAAPSVTRTSSMRQAADRSMHGDVEHLLNQPDRG